MTDFYELYCQKSMEHRACAVMMKPSAFLELVGLPERKDQEEKDASEEFFNVLAEAQPNAHALTPLWLRVAWDDKHDIFKVVDHDGRYRCLYLLNKPPRQDNFLYVLVEAAGRLDDAYHLRESVQRDGLMSSDFATHGFEKPTDKENAIITDLCNVDRASCAKYKPR